MNVTAATPFPDLTRLARSLRTHPIYASNFPTPSRLERRTPRPKRVRDGVGTRNRTMPRRIDDGLKKRCGHKRKTWIDCECPWWFGFHHRGREYRYSLTKLAHARGFEPPKSKDEAITWRDRFGAEIRSGTFVDPDATPLGKRLVPPPRSPMCIFTISAGSSPAACSSRTRTCTTNATSSGTRTSRRRRRTSGARRHDWHGR